MTVNKESALIVELPSDTEIVMKRTFNAPRELVFEAFTKPEHLVHWWGPRGTTLSICTFDARPGGKWQMVMQSPDGNEIDFHGDVVEITPYERIVWTFGWTGMPGEPGPEEVTFEEREGKTAMTARAIFPNKESRDAALQSGMESGARETYERLEEHLAKLA